MSDDDESPWIDMDGNINEMSPENKSPTTYSRPDTPEIDKLKSLMVSSPSTDRSNRSNRSTKSNKSFYEKLEEYYNLKEQYDQKLRDAHTEWNNARPPMSLEKKKENYQNFMMNRKCINCEKGPGGTIFSQVGIGRSRKITAICGCEDKCDLNIEIYMGESNYIPDEIEYYKNRVEELKKDINEYKFDLLFDLRDEELVLTEFRTIKDQLTENLDQLVTYKKAFDRKNENVELGNEKRDGQIIQSKIDGTYRINTNILEIFNTFNYEVEPDEDGNYTVNRKKYIEIMNKHLNNLISDFKVKTKDYIKEPSKSKLKDNFDFLVNEVQKVQDAIRDEKYHIIYMDTLENNAKKGFKKQKMMDTYVFNPSKYNVNNQIITTGNKITQFKR